MMMISMILCKLQQRLVFQLWLKYQKLLAFLFFFSCITLSYACAKLHKRFFSEKERESTYTSLFVSFVHFTLLFSYSVLYLFCHSLFCCCVLLLFLCIVFTAWWLQTKQKEKEKKLVEVFIVEQEKLYYVVAHITYQYAYNIVLYIMSNHIAPSFEIKREKNDRKRYFTTAETHNPTQLAT